MGSSDWERKEPYEHMWVGLNGKRTIGQQRGERTADGCNSTAAGEVVSDVCYGWATHDKPSVLRSNQLSTGLTVVAHLDMGVVNRIQWDSSCNLCPSHRDAELSCLPDETNALCVGGAPCRDCYAQLSSDCSGADAVCAPKVYLAWLGTDADGRPLLSAGSVLSRFAAHSVSGVTRGLVDEIQRLADGLIPPNPPSPPGNESHAQA